MAVMMPRERWTDDRLDDLNKKVDEGFAEMKTRFDRVEDRFERIEDRFQALNRTLIGGTVAILVAMIGSSAF